MRFPKLFSKSAYPELDRELRKKLSQYKGRKIMVVVHVRVLHMSFSFENYIMYLFSKKSVRVLGIKHGGTPSTVDENIRFGKTIADFYSRRGRLKVERIEIQFTSNTPWPG